MVPQPHSPDPALGRAIRALREERGLTQEGLASASGLTFATVSALERGRTAPMFATVRAIARALDVSMAELGAAIDAQD